MLACKLAGALTIALMFLNGGLAGIINGLMIIPLAYIDIKMEMYEIKERLRK